MLKQYCKILFANISSMYVFVCGSVPQATLYETLCILCLTYVTVNKKEKISMPTKHQTCHTWVAIT